MPGPHPSYLIPVRVLLVEEGWTQTIDVARVLEARGFSVTVLTANGSRARYRRRSVTWLSGPRVTDVALARQVAELAHGVDRIVPMTERVMAQLWAASSPAIEPRLFPATEPWQRALVTDKHELIELMRARGIDVPRQVPLSRAAELGLPVVFKAAIGAAGTHVHIADTPAARTRQLARLAHSDEAWVAQEHIPGPTYLVGGLFHDGLPLRLYAAEKIEQYPPRTGPAIRLRSCDDEALVEAGLRALAQLRWTGLASVDLMRRADGRYVVLEVNPRPWGSLAGARAAGVDLLAGFADLMTGRVPRADLAYQTAEECLIFPRYLLAPAYRSVAGLSRALRDLGGEQGRDWRHPGFALHLIRRVL
jgi:predicted ATP-grasp superfamily ATP-dependent carboligase